MKSHPSSTHLDYLKLTMLPERFILQVPKKLGFSLQKNVENCKRTASLAWTRSRMNLGCMIKQTRMLINDEAD
jgi:hypothetical protein